MAGFVDRIGDDGEMRLESLSDLRHYCYVVAGIVGELLTELFLLKRPEFGAGRGLAAGTFAPFRRSPPTRQHPQGLRLGTQGRRYLPEVARFQQRPQAEDRSQWRDARGAPAP